MEAFIQYDFLRNAVITGVLIGFTAPVLGVFIVVRRLALITDALSHITLTGIAFHLFLSQTLSILTGLSPVYMGMVFAAAGSLLIEKLRLVYTAYQELAVPIILSSAIGLGVIFISLADGFNQDLFQYLFGSIIAVSRDDLAAVAGITAFVAVVLILFYNQLLFIAFDENQARVSGIPVKSMNLLFIIMTALVIATSMQLVGILLVSSLMTLPVAAALQVAKSFRQMFMYSVIVGESAVISGMISAFYLDVSSGGMIVLAALFLLFSAMMYRRASGRPVYHPGRQKETAAE
ncbi:metal ABC transporter permease [Salibacterium qingdaonense]|uniref:Zinc transport system permease protein n=1 Tax=Salibacterium qingdaonense TaxID=266892 RepID=A0A1I4JKD9_9BACI|nr:metal ABC transporter permease [Salibacterium qingdaonense]SFL66964.1 zinc transport system permease protein [Salibacterium qingdaonense]